MTSAWRWPWSGETTRINTWSGVDSEAWLQARCYTRAELSTAPAASQRQTNQCDPGEQTSARKDGEPIAAGAGRLRPRAREVRSSLDCVPGALAALVVACGGADTGASPAPSADEDERGSVGAPPASEYCKKLGYPIEGSDCVLPDSARCELWSFYRDE